MEKKIHIVGSVKRLRREKQEKTTTPARYRHYIYDALAVAQGFSNAV